MLRENIQDDEIGLLGIRLGATLATYVAEEDKNISRLVLWEPVIKGTRHMKEMFRINISTQTAVYKEVRYNTDMLIEQLKKGKTVNIDGYEMKLPLYEQMINIDLLNSQKRFQGKTLIIQINKREGMGTKKIDELGVLYPESSKISVVEQPFWKEIREYYAKANNLYDATLNWLKTT